MQKLNQINKTISIDESDLKLKTRAVGKSRSGRRFLRFVLGAAILLFLLAPLFMTLIYSLFRDFTGILPRGFTLSFYREVLFGSSSIIPVLLRTLLISLIPVIISMLTLLAAIYVKSLYFPAIDKALNLITKIPYSIQGIILAISLISIYGNSSSFLANRVLLLILAYTVVISPYVYQGILNALSTVEMLPIIEAAEVLGAGKSYAFFKLVLPAARQGLLATSLLSTGILFGDFVIVNILAGSYYETMAIRLRRIMAYSGNQAAVVSVILFTMMSLLSIYVSHLNKKKPGEGLFKKSKRRERTKRTGE